MAKLIAIYHQPVDQEGFEKHYNEVHIPLAQKLPNLIGAGVHHVLQTQNTNDNLYLMAELEFETPEAMFQALSSPEGKEMQGDTKNLMPYLSKPPIVSIVD
jgi:uncharacterized protein (TIGR02118 family)